MGTMHPASRSSRDNAEVVEGEVVEGTVIDWDCEVLGKELAGEAG